MSIKLLVTIIYALNLVQSQHIVDYNHSSYMERRQALPHRNYNIDIHPSRDKKDYLDFPTSCDLEASLSVTALVEQNQRILSSQEKQIQRLKTNMTYLLKLAQYIKRAKSFLRQYKFQQEEVELQIDPSQLQFVQSFENGLLEKKQQINKLISNVAQFIHRQFNSTKKSGWEEMHLEFQQKIYLSRLNYLLKLKQSLQKGEKPSESNYNNFFSQILIEISTEKQQLSGIGEILGNFSSSNELKLKISSLENQLQALNLMIKQREECILKKDEYTFETRNQLQKTYKELKILKKTESSNRQFCQGVAASLQKQLKKLLKVYNYSFGCAQGLPKLQNTRIILVNQLYKLRKQYKDIDYDRRVEFIKKQLQNHQDKRDRLIEEINHFKLSKNRLKIDQYHLNITKVQRQIEKTRVRLASIDQKLKNPTNSKGNEINYDQIRDIIDEIQKQQHAYCVLKEQYQQKYRNIDVKLRSIELQTKIRSTHYSNFVAKFNQLRQLQQEFIQVKNTIIEQLE